MNKYKKRQLIILKKVEAKSNGKTPINLRLPTSWNESYGNLVENLMLTLDSGEYFTETGVFEHNPPLLIGITAKGKQRLRDLQDECNAEWWERVKFLIPVIISVVALLVAIFRP